MQQFSRLAALLALCISTGCASNPAPSLSIGSQVDFNLLEDQFGHSFTYQDQMKLVLYVDTMRAKNLVRDSLNDIDVSCLKDGRVVYLADISGMPGLISRLIAVPRMRDYPYPVWLDRNGLATEALPIRDDAVTVLLVDHQAITGMEFYLDVQQLLKPLLAECGPAHQQVALQEAHD